MKDYITVIGGGLAGCEAAYQIAKRGIKVKLYEMKPDNYSPAHTNQNLAEIVCSNSLKSNLITNACGLLKEELRQLDSLLIHIADKTQIPAGQALAVDREEFSKKVTDAIENEILIEVIRKEVKSKYCSEEMLTEKEDKKEKEDRIEKEAVTKIQNNNLNSTKQSTEYEKNVDNEAIYNVDNVDNEAIYLEDLIKDGIVIIATGPLTSNSLSVGIQHLINEKELHFYDAQAPIIEKESIDFNIAFYGNRYEQEKKKDETLEEWHERIKTITPETQSYINLPLNKEEYENFINELVNADVVTLKEFEKREIFEGCMPVEIMAKRGIETLRFGPLKPVGFDDPRTGKRPYAVVQLRQDNNQASLYNIVGFQTNLKFGEQRKVFSMIPGLKEAEFVKYGVMHRNTFINSSKLLDNTYNLKSNNNIYFAGQITGVEGYVESISSGYVAGVNAVNLYKSKQRNSLIKSEKENNSIKSHSERIEVSEQTMIGALAKYISSPNDKFQPMNANFGIMHELEGERIKDKKERYQRIAKRSLKNIKGQDI